MSRRRNPRRLYGWSYFDESCVVDPDFDDASDAIGLYEHELATTGAIDLHPDGDRRDPIYDPVPLCSHVPDGDEFFNEKPIKEIKEPLTRPYNRKYFEEMKEHYARMAVEKRAQEEREAKWEVERKQRDEDARLRRLAYEEGSQARRKAMAAWSQRAYEDSEDNRATPKSYRYTPVEEEESAHDRMLRSMRVKEPPPSGIGRLWQSYLMLNLEDRGNPALETRKHEKLIEVYRDDRVIIFKRMVATEGLEGMWLSFGAWL